MSEFCSESDGSPFVILVEHRSNSVKSAIRHDIDRRVAIYVLEERDGCCDPMRLETDT